MITKSVSYVPIKEVLGDLALEFNPDIERIGFGGKYNKITLVTKEDILKELDSLYCEAEDWPEDEPEDCTIRIDELKRIEKSRKLITALKKGTLIDLES